MIRFAALSGMILLGLGAPARHLAGQDHPNLSGTWRLEMDRSDFGSLPAPVAGVDEIDHIGDAITIHRIRDIGQGPVPSRIVYRTDGKEHVNSAAGLTTRSTLRWDGSVLEIRSVTQTDVYEVLVVDRWSLSADGTTITVQRHVEIPGIMEAEQTQVLTKR